MNPSANLTYCLLFYILRFIWYFHLILTFFLFYDLFSYFECLFCDLLFYDFCHLLFYILWSMLSFILHAVFFLWFLLSLILCSTIFFFILDITDIIDIILLISSFIYLSIRIYCFVYLKEYHVGLTFIYFDPLSDTGYSFGDALLFIVFLCYISFFFFSGLYGLSDFIKVFTVL